MKHAKTGTRMHDLDRNGNWTDLMEQSAHDGKKSQLNAIPISTDKTYEW